jgi:hypothetical protein
VQKNTITKSRVLLGAMLVVLSAISGLASCGGKEPSTLPSPKVATIVFHPPVIVPSSIAAVQAFYASAAMRGTVHYFCDCGTGASASCVVGSESNDGLTPDGIPPHGPKQLFATAISTLNSMTTTGTVALCKGGSFTDTANNWNSMNQTHCSAGTAVTTCFDLRDYDPTTFAATAKPIVKIKPSGEAYIFQFATATGGYRIMNLRFQSQGTSQLAMAFLNPGRDVVFGNNEIDGFVNAIQTSYNGVNPTNITIEGNLFTNNKADAFLGSGDNLNLNYNYMHNNGGDGGLDHSVYLSAHWPVTTVNVIGNYADGASTKDTKCWGSMIVAHGEFTGLTITDNTLAQITAVPDYGCWGIDLDNGGYASNYGIGSWFRNSVIARNTMINTGNAGIVAMSFPNGLIEDNLIISDWAGSSYGISLADEAKASGGLDDFNTAVTIRNNTIWYGPSAAGANGINIGPLEGTGYVLANNSITYTATSATYAVNCFSIGRGFADVAFMNNNHCNIASVSYAWEKTNGATLDLWRKNSGLDLNSITSDPSFVNATAAVDRDFHPSKGSSPLIGAGTSSSAPTNAQAPTYDLSGTKKFADPATIGAFEVLP